MLIIFDVNCLATVACTKCMRTVEKLINDVRIAFKDTCVSLNYEQLIYWF